MKKKDIAYRQLAKLLLSSVLTFLSLLCYVVEARPVLFTFGGNYLVGFSDGSLAIIFVLIVGLYLKS